MQGSLRVRPAARSQNHSRCGTPSKQAVRTPATAQPALPLAPSARNSLCAAVAMHATGKESVAPQSEAQQEHMAQKLMESEGQEEPSSSDWGKGGNHGERMPGQKRAVAMHVAYVGSDFRGLQISRDFSADTTVEGVLERALLDAKLIAPSNYGDLFKVKWTRSSRTDKGVHSLATVIGCRVVLENADDVFLSDPEGQSLAASLNTHLPPSVRVLSVQRVNKKFNARRACMERTYEYYLPASLLGMKCDGSEEDARILSTFREALQLYEGKHPFHNFTVRRKQYATQGKQQGPKGGRRAAADDGVVEDEESGDEGAVEDEETTLTPESEQLRVGAEGVSQLATSTGCGSSPVGTDPAPSSGGGTQQAAGEPTPVQAHQQQQQQQQQQGEQQACQLAQQLQQQSLGLSSQQQQQQENGQQQQQESGQQQQQQENGPQQQQQGTRRWTQLCHWKSEKDEADAVSVRHYRVIKSFTADDPQPLVQGGEGAVRITVTGLSFMLNQIRHMIGGAVAVARGFIPIDLLRASLSAPARVSVPKAPPHTLLLGAATFIPFRSVGDQDARAALFSGDALTLRERGRAAQAEFREQALAPVLAAALSHQDWAHFDACLSRFLWYPEAVTKVVAAHAAWVAERQAARQQAEARQAAQVGEAAAAQPAAQAITNEEAATTGE